MRWLSVRARNLHVQEYPDCGVVFSASEHWRRRLAARHGIRRRKRTNSNAKPLADRLPGLKRFHANLAALVSLRRPDRPDQRFDPKFGRFLPQMRFSVDQARAPARAPPRALAARPPSLVLAQRHAAWVGASTRNEGRASALRRRGICGGVRPGGQWPSGDDAEDVRALQAEFVYVLQPRGGVRDAGGDVNQCSEGGDTVERQLAAPGRFPRARGP